MIDRRRLIPAVILGAVGLLALKALSWTSALGPDGFGTASLRDQVVRPGASASGGAFDVDDYRGFTKVMARARAPYVIAPETTGSVEKKPASPAPAAEAPATAAPLNRAEIMNSGTRIPSDAERALTERLQERRNEIANRQRELDLREKLLATAERKLDARVGELKAIETQNEDRKEAAGNGAAQGLKKLVIMYENMKPKDAARVFDRLGIDILVPVVLQMNPRKMSEVLAAMSPESAEKLTVALATRAAMSGTDQGSTPQRALPPTELQAITPQRR